MSSDKKVLITGVAGFIGMHLAKSLLEAGYKVVGMDNLNPYYPVKLKRDRLARLGIIAHQTLELREKVEGFSNFTFYYGALEDRAFVDSLFENESFNAVVHLGAQAGVRHSITNPHTYVESNITGTIHILEGCRHTGVEHLIYASSSSVYGLNTSKPFKTSDNVDRPISLYAATKKANELMAHTYSYLYNIPTTGLRFFTVYGPWGRPDMAPYIFTKLILAGEPIDIFNHGNMGRDFTYVDDIVESIVRLIPIIPQIDSEWDEKDPSSTPAPYKIYNIGNNAPVRLMDFVKAIEIATGIEAQKVYKPLQPGDVPNTWADVEPLFAATGFKPQTKLQDGVNAFVKWYKEYHDY